MFILKESPAVASGDTSVLLKKAIADAARQNQLFNVLRHSIGKHREKLSSLDTNAFKLCYHTLQSLLKFSMGSTSRLY